MFGSKRNRNLDTTPVDIPCNDKNDGGAVPGLSNLYAPENDLKKPVRDVADVLLETEKITKPQYDRIRQFQTDRPGRDIVEVIRESGVVDSDNILIARAGLHGYEYRRIKVEDVRRDAFDKLGLDYVRKNKVMPIADENGTLVIATSEPDDVFVLDDVKRHTGMNIKIIVCSRDDIDTVCEVFSESKWTDCVKDIIQDITDSDVEVIQDSRQEAEDLEKMAGESPIIKFVNHVISSAVYEGASDIHIEPKEKLSKVRYRIDGILFESMTIPAAMHSAVVSRFKIMSNLDISERRLPQDGRISAIVVGREIDLRVSTLPTSFGEKVVIRVLDSKSILLELEQLGMEPDVLSAVRRQIRKPHGIILVTGPTGSGKTTTLYSALNQMASAKLNISTVEDPVEYQLNFCNQVQVNEKIGLTFASSLRSLLRQDPDVIMIGEIRDTETAQIAVQAALAGHFVLSTLHTNDAASSIMRLVDICVEPYLIAASLNAVLAQRLVRKSCPHCRQRYKIPGNMADVVASAGLGDEELFAGTGCENCRQTGYIGRFGIYELLEIDDNFRDIIADDSSIDTIQRAFDATGRARLVDDGMKKVKKGLTTIEEIFRVTEASGKKVKKNVGVTLHSRLGIA